MKPRTKRFRGNVIAPLEAACSLCSASGRIFTTALPGALRAPLLAAMRTGYGDARARTGILLW